MRSPLDYGLGKHERASMDLIHSLPVAVSGRVLDYCCLPDMPGVEVGTTCWHLQGLSHTSGTTPYGYGWAPCYPEDSLAASYNAVIYSKIARLTWDLIVAMH
jgi:hypothetical protein